MTHRRPPTPSSSDFCKLTGLNQINQDIPFVLGENREIASLADPDLIAGEFHFRTQPTPGRAQQHFAVVHYAHLLSLIFSRSM